MVERGEVPIKHLIRKTAGHGMFPAGLFPLIIFQHSIYMAWIIWLVTIFAIISLMVYRVRMGPYDLYVDDNSINVNGYSLEGHDIKKITIMGYFRPVIGILPQGKKIIPTRLCFRFARDEDRAIADLTRWAENNEVPVRKGAFLTWV